jgi:hypothetical protein
MHSGFNVAHALAMGSSFNLFYYFQKYNHRERREKIIFDEVDRFLLISLCGPLYFYLLYLLFF